MQWTNPANGVMNICTKSVTISIRTILDYECSN